MNNFRYWFSIVFLFSSIVYFVARLVWIIRYKVKTKNFEKKFRFEKRGAFLLFASAICAVAMLYLEPQMREYARNAVVEHRTSNFFDYLFGKTKNTVEIYYFVTTIFSASLIMFVTFIMDYVAGNSIYITEKGIYGFDSKLMPTNKCLYSIEKTSDETPKTFLNFFDKNGKLIEKINIKNRESEIKDLLEEFYVKKNKTELEINEISDNGETADDEIYDSESEEIKVQLED